MTAPSFEKFLFLSVDLTAFDETDLLGTGMAHRYLAKVRAACGDEVVTALLEAHRAARDDAAGDAGSHARARSTGICSTGPCATGSSATNGSARWPAT